MGESAAVAGGEDFPFFQWAMARSTAARSVEMPRFQISVEGMVVASGWPSPGTGYRGASVAEVAQGRDVGEELVVGGGRRGRCD
jgi:hypothetical protein